MTRYKPLSPSGFWAIIASVLSIDFLSKALAVAFLDVHEPATQVVGDVVRLHLAYNPGAAFSTYLGPWSRWIFSVLAVAALVVLVRLYRATRTDESTRVLALALLIAGAAGNLFDRLRSSRGVVDFIDIGVGAIRFWTFNVADSAVSVGAVLLAWTLWRDGRTPAGAA